MPVTCLALVLLISCSDPKPDLRHLGFELPASATQISIADQPSGLKDSHRILRFWTPARDRPELLRKLPCAPDATGACTSRKLHTEHIVQLSDTTDRSSIEVRVEIREHDNCLFEGCAK